ncbi:hypothetical protein HN419_07200 [Candidatus Woesearchaeota archaeon]|jgi:hypothetical protein|nr:hypothetical protein [Candidatus Woesearchaeota archaeon]MBT3538279.1 hypothetical protein [Candidatus Woesearchaeota archaeon]MBT4697566.1 hypothetical protein [Candidatus Woesearchaeota archaeon]MBT4717445.1 hypothetical protein [Candidatus Woesearchaeota archaeon]MBT7105948.1 hypothetical protein [Candidatus Woesearchaeota archaeon]
MLEKKRCLVLVVLFLLGLPGVVALSDQVGFIPSWDGFADGMKGFSGMIHDVLTNQWVAFFLLIIFMYLILYAILASAISKIKMFQGGGAMGLSGYGKMLAVSVSMLAVLGFGYSNRDKTVAGIMKPFLGDYAYLFASCLVVLFALWMYKYFKGDLKKTFLATAFASAATAVLTDTPALFAFAIVFLIIGVITLVRGLGKFSIRQAKGERAKIGNTLSKLRFKEGSAAKEEKNVGNYEDLVDKHQLNNIEKDRWFEKYLPGERKAYDYLHRISDVARAQAKGGPEHLNIDRDVANRLQSRAAQLRDDLSENGYRDLAQLISHMPKAQAIQAIDEVARLPDVQKEFRNSEIHSQRDLIDAINLAHGMRGARA